MTPIHRDIHSVAELGTALHVAVKPESYGCSNWQLKYGFTRFVAVLKVKGLATRSRLITQQSLISGSLENFTCDKTRSARKTDVESFALFVRLSARAASACCRSFDSLISCNVLHICTSVHLYKTATAGAIKGYVCPQMYMVYVPLVTFFRT
jgi:hypothetical protein